MTQITRFSMASNFAQFNGTNSDAKHTNTHSLEGWRLYFWCSFQQCTRVLFNGTHSCQLETKVQIQAQVRKENEREREGKMDAGSVRTNQWFVGAARTFASHQCCDGNKVKTHGVRHEGTNNNNKRPNLLSLSLSRLPKHTLGTWVRINIKSARVKCHQQVANEKEC